MKSLLPFILSFVAAALSACSAHDLPRSRSSAPIRHSSQSGPLRLAVISTSHDHVHNPFRYAREHPEHVRIVGVYEPDRARFDRFAEWYGLDPSLRYDDLGRMLDETHPEAASIMTSPRDHLTAVEACAPRGVHLLVEKPLAFANEAAQQMAALAREHGVLLLTNYETSWYASVRTAKHAVDLGEMTPVRRMVFRHGHRGPREIGCSEEFLAWLTDPDESGGGAITDFGCYGAILATWFMDGRAPDRIVASVGHFKPDVYPNVDDDATIVLTYPGATAVLQASWCWTHDVKEMDVYTETGSIHAGKWDDLSIRAPDRPARKIDPAEKPDYLQNEWIYLRKVIRGECPVDPLSGLEMNLVATQILDAARKSARSRTTTPHEE
jgi:predicted dehydrogenase